MNRRSSLMQVARFGLIKVVPGVFNLMLIPFLLVALGSNGYGHYSIWLSYAMLVANIVAAIVSQPMYRYLSSCPEESLQFASFAVGASGLAGLTSFGVTMLVGAPWMAALGFAVLSIGAVLGTALSIEFVVLRQFMRLAIYETLRILAVFLAIAIPLLIGRQLAVGDVVLAMALSNILPIMFLAGQRRFTSVTAGWLRRVVPYGLKSASWLLLAGLPVVSAKSILMQAMPEHSFGIYAAIADLTYRGFALANAALMMWAFPLLSRQFDDGRIAEVGRTLRFTLLLYSASGVVIIACVVLTTKGLKLIDVSSLPGGLIAAIAVTLANFGWHAMSISHKPFELTLRTTRMAGLMAFGVVVFYGGTFSLIRLVGLDELYAVTMVMTSIAFTYIAISLSQRLVR